MIKGSKQWARKIASLKQVTATRIDAALQEGAQEIIDMQKKSNNDETGELDRSLNYKRIGNRKTKSKGENIRYLISSDAFYASWVEFGTSAHTAGGKFAGAKHPGARPAPFFYPGYRVAKRGVMRKLQKAVRLAVTDAVKK